MHRNYVDRRRRRDGCFRYSSGSGGGGGGGGGGAAACWPAYVCRQPIVYIDTETRAASIGFEL